MRTSSAPSCLERTQLLSRRRVTTFEQALEAQSAPGSNLKGSVDGANWCFLLPRLELGRVLTVGCLPPSSLATVSKFGDDVLVWVDATDRDRVRDIIERRNLTNVDVLAAEPGGAFPLPDDDVDLVVLAKPRLARSLAVRDELARVSKPTGTLYVESTALPSRRDHGSGHAWRLDGATRRTVLWSAPAWGELRFAAPAGDGAAVSYLERHFLKPLLRRKLLKRPGKVAARTPLANRLTRRRALLLTGEERDGWAGPPAYVRTIAAQAGEAIESRRWAFAAPGEYSSQKALFFVFDDEADEPKSVVKITRDGRHNSRPLIPLPTQRWSSAGCELSSPASKTSTAPSGRRPRSSKASWPRSPQTRTPCVWSSSMATRDRGTSS
jgi:hypothetical protein